MNSPAFCRDQVTGLMPRLLFYVGVPGPRLTRVVFFNALAGMIRAAILI